MKLKKTDNRFNLRRFGFDCYVEFNDKDWKNYNRYVSYCRKTFGNEFLHFNGRTFQEGNWRSLSHINKRHRSKRIYFRGEKYHTILLMTVETEPTETFYL